MEPSNGASIRAAAPAACPNRCRNRELACGATHGCPEAIPHPGPAVSRCTRLRRSSLDEGHDQIRCALRLSPGVTNVSSSRFTGYREWYWGTPTGTEYQYPPRYRPSRDHHAEVATRTTPPRHSRSIRTDGLWSHADVIRPRMLVAGTSGPGCRLLVAGFWCAQSLGASPAGEFSHAMGLTLGP